MASMKAKQLRLTTVALLSLQAGCQSLPAYYSTADFARVKKFDTHVHLNTRSTALVEQAIADNFELLTINVDYPDFPPFVEQFDAAVAQATAHPDVVHFAATFTMGGWTDRGDSAPVIESLKKAREQGAVAVKVWKNIGMEVRDAEGSLLMIDDPRLDPIFDWIEQSGMRLIGHQGEPRNCWLPLEQMSVNNDREYFREHPQYYMYLHPEMPTYEEQMTARDNRLARHPGLHFIGAHLASLEWSVDELAAFLDRFANASVDMAARMGQLQAQSQQDRDRVRNFLIRYQDRVMYATDLGEERDSDPVSVAAEVHERWLADWRYLAGDGLLTNSDIDGAFRGLHLPRDVIDKIYYANAHAVLLAGGDKDQRDKDRGS
jgi:predicted TIM-barrel fold metal-dependent hydrolase